MKKQYLFSCSLSARLVLCFSLLLFLTGCTSGNSRSIITDTYTIHSENISNQSINCFEEDQLGYMWIGTIRGANRYNGYDYAQYFSTEDSMSLSGNRVQQVFNDSKGRIWICTSVGINLLNQQGEVSGIPIESDSRNARQIRETSDGRLFLNTSSNICEYNEEENRFVSRFYLPFEKSVPINIFIDKANRLWGVGLLHITCFDVEKYEKLFSFTNEITYYSFLRSNGELWFSQPQGVKIIDTKTGNYVSVPMAIRNHPVLSSASVTLIHPYDDVSLLIRTNTHGLYYYNMYTNEVLHESDNEFPFEVPDMEITALYTDKNKNLWIGSYDQGFTVRYHYKQRFNTNDYLRAQTENKSVVAVVADKERNLWITTRRHGLMRWNQKENRIIHIPLPHLFPDMHPNRVIFTGIFIDSRNHIWLQANTRLVECQQVNGELRHVKTYPLPDGINCMTEDHSGTIWGAGTSEFIYKLSPGSATFEQIQLYPKSYHFTNGLLTLSGGKLMIATLNENLYFIDPDTGDKEAVDISPYLNGQVFIPTALFEDAEGFVWIGTFNTGLFRYSQLTGKIERMSNGICNDITSIIEDIQGNMWIGTMYGLSKYDRTVDRFTTYYASDGIGGNQFNERSVCRFPDNTLVFGGTHGLTSFNPIDVTSRRQIPLFVEGLKVHNHFIKAAPGSIIETTMVHSPTVRLAYDQNNIQLYYAALDYSEYSRVQYSYKLEGFDTDWVDAGNHRQAFYSNLPAGNYTFRVKTTNPDDSIAETFVSVPVLISRAPWLSGYAILLYCLLSAGILYVIFRVYRHVQANRRHAIQILREKEQEQYVNKMNMSFFSNISHEFRTPLTMIAGPLGLLYKRENMYPEEKHLLQIIRRNVDRMLRLVNQLMDFNKLENDTLRLEVEQVDVIHVLNEYLEIYHLNVLEKEIRLNLYGIKDRCMVWIDTDKLEKIVGNLLLNALKFTPPGGQIDIKFDIISSGEAAALFPLSQKEMNPEYMMISVGDSGSGIPEDNLEEIFNKYSQVDQATNVFRNWGTGIGLYFARRLAEMHHGYIKAENKPQGGALLTFILPVNQSAYAESEKRKVARDPRSFIIEGKSVIKAEHFPQVETKQKKDGRPTLLVVDDDTEISHYLRVLLSTDYQVEIRFDADKAWESIEEVEPDLIISDVVMPGTDGYTFCRKIKENLATSHIPVILLTAKITTEEHVEGMNVGANAYITKPFDPTYLLALIRSQLRNRDNARRLLIETTDTQTLSEEVLSAKDKVFMDDLYALMEKELSNPEVNVSQMIETLKISRTRFYYKVKGLTGENPNTLFKSYKLNRAAELIKEGKYNMSEIADKTGFSTPSHFSASFKKKFGITPTEFVGKEK